MAIHPFPNGNGRYRWIAADHLAMVLYHRGFSWGASLGMNTED